MDINLGSPVGAYYWNQGVFMRDFARGKALSNPFSVSKNVELGRALYLLNGTEVYSLTLHGYSGEILLNSFEPSP